MSVGVVITDIGTHTLCRTFTLDKLRENIFVFFGRKLNGQGDDQFAGSSSVTSYNSFLCFE